MVNSKTNKQKLMELENIKRDLIELYKIDEYIYKMESDTNISDIIKDIETCIGKQRMLHSKRVAKEALILSKRFNLDLKDDKIYLAGILHDCVKIKNQENLDRLCIKYNFKVDNIYKYNKELIHSVLGSIVAKEKYNITDTDILNAIRYHTTGRENMSDLEKIIFISDYIEPLRNFDGVNEVRLLAYENLDLAIIKSLNQTMMHLIEKNILIIYEYVLARNYLLIHKEDI